MIPQGQQSESATHESKDADVIGLGMLAGLLFVLLAMSLLICGGVLHLFNRGYTSRRVNSDAGTKSTPFPAPHLLVHPGAERARADLAGKRALETYGWVNRKAKIAHIPISRAMELLVTRGLPAAGAGQTRLQLMQSRPQTEQSVTPSPQEGRP